jgi:hypothetical protein
MKERVLTWKADDNDGDADDDDYYYNNNNLSKFKH